MSKHETEQLLNLLQRLEMDATEQGDEQTKRMAKGLFTILCRRHHIIEKQCNHLLTIASYTNRKLNGYICQACGELIEVNPQYKKRNIA